MLCRHVRIMLVVSKQVAEWAMLQGRGCAKTSDGFKLIWCLTGRMLFLLAGRLVWAGHRGLPCLATLTAVEEPDLQSVAMQHEELLQTKSSWAGLGECGA